MVTVLAVALHAARQPDYDRADNDLKYRYIRMKGEASPENISGLENIFGFNRDNGKINQMRKDVEAYEEAVHRQAILAEQARLKERAARSWETRPTRSGAEIQKGGDDMARVKVKFRSSAADG